MVAILDFPVPSYRIVIIIIIVIVVVLCLAIDLEKMGAYSCYNVVSIWAAA